ncbi:hypothetical protein BO86DRAFT_208853 [Aspergillus japonicus CBS 114.51]|uniref:Uncharacterized protein n=1 Tax=Aspergillus japonicus CBS 114.51 TaxID=1448312 RepID=A0A8T8X9W3_ASPJA|nr:hypothetical protein BO86DRAFT_208853 [Aspergillus japonicus CBS 114.51]RAH84871.1 hypothetical protein BO86DRAFT_208853 [Aspergillus japonicus CBS 114.51]
MKSSTVLYSTINHRITTYTLPIPSTAHPKRQRDPPFPSSSKQRTKHLAPPAATTSSTRKQQASPKTGNPSTCQRQDEEGIQTRTPPL